MTIQIKFFASLKENLQIDNQVIDATHINTAKDAWIQATNHASVPENVLCAINQQHADLNATLNDGDEVAFFPPVTGG